MSQTSVSPACAHSFATADSNERKTHESISSLKHHFVVSVRRSSSILKNVAEKFYVEFHFFGNIVAINEPTVNLRFTMTNTDRPVQLLYTYTFNFYLKTES